jgi:peptidoglycan/LPS O-acetylase OafA/YrhL
MAVTQTKPRSNARFLSEFDPRDNCIGFLRFFCAMLVLVSHDYGLGGYNGASEWVVALSHNEWSFGTVAVSSFFFLSGFLVTRSYLSINDAIRFVWHRCLRIYPAFWACLIVTAFGFGGALYFGTHGTLHGFFDTAVENSPWGFIYHNYTLEMYQFDVLQLVQANPYKLGLNGSLWTLGTEFRCYLFVAFIGLIGILLRARIVAPIVFCLLYALSVWPPVFPHATETFPALGFAFRGTYAFEEMSTYFMAGCTALLYAERIPIRTTAAGIAFLIGIAVLPFHWFRGVETFALSYVLMWVITRRPLVRFSRGADYSYGIYLYAFPAAQTLTYFHANAFGLPVFDVFTTALTVGVAALSWHLIERPAMRLKDIPFPRWFRLSTPAVFLEAFTQAGIAVHRATDGVTAKLRNAGVATRSSFSGTRTPLPPVGRVGLLFALATAAYVVALVLIFPHYVAPFGAHHSDMYIAPDLAAQHASLARLLAAPRPVIWIVEESAGYLGLEGSIAAFLALALLDLALAIFILERYVMKRLIPAWICFLTFLLAMSAPGAYINAGYDIGTALGMLFGFLGIIVWESRWRGATIAGAICTFLFVLSLLSKEGFAPILFVYAVALAWRPRRIGDRFALLFVAIAFFSLLADARLTHSAFVSSRDASEPYFVSFAPGTIVECIEFYFGPLLSPSIVILTVSAIFAAFLARRGRLAVVILLSALSLQLPYLILPNHRLGYYWWVTIPILMLLVPLALTPATAVAGDAGLRGSRARAWISAAVVIFLLLSVGQYEPIDAADEQWFVVQQKINEVLMHDLRRHDREIRSAHNVLVTGLSFPFHPWSHGYFIDKELHYRGQWTVAVSPDQAPVPAQIGVAAIDYPDVRWRDYDLVLVFDGSGHLVGAYPPDQIESYANPKSGPRLDPLQVVQYVQTAAPAAGEAATPAPEASDAIVSPELPSGVVTDGAVAPSGIYRRDGNLCCWVGSSATFDVAVPKRAHTLTLTIYIPDVTPAGTTPTELFVRSRAGSLLGSSPLHPGLQVVAIKVPAPDGGERFLPVTIKPDRAFVPKALGLNGDPRTLSFVLEDVRFE